MTWLSENPALAACIALVIAFPVLRRAVADLAWPMQMRLADDIRWLREGGRLTPGTRQAVELMGRHAFDWLAIVVFVVALPFALWRHRRRLGAPEPGPIDGYPAETQAVLDRVVRRFLLSIAAVNPVFALLFLIEMLAVVAIGSLLYLIHVTARKPLQQAEDSLHEAVTWYDRLMTRST